MKCSACGSENCGCDKGGKCACAENCLACASKRGKGKEPKTSVPSEAGSGNPRT